MWIFRTKVYNSKRYPTPHPSLCLLVTIKRPTAVSATDPVGPGSVSRLWPGSGAHRADATLRRHRRHRASDERRPPGVRRIMMFLLRSVGDKNDKIKVWGFVGEESNVLCDGSLNIERKPDLFPFLSFRLFLFLCFTFFLSFPPVILAQKSPS